MIGADSPEADAEMVAILATFFKTTGLTPKEVLILVNDRRLMENQFDKFGVSAEMRPVVSGWIDRKEKMAPEAWEAFGNEKGITLKQMDSIKSMLTDKELWRSSPELVRFFKAIECLGVKEYVSFDPGIMRGLLYYTGIVFEAWEVGGEIKRSINGGGRYDNLLSDVGGEPLPGTGFAMGDVVVSLIFEKYGKLPKDLQKNPAEVLVTVFSGETLLDSVKLAVEMRRSGLKAAIYPDVMKLPKQFKYADRMGIKVVLVMGPDEAAAGTVTVKDLRSGTQQTLPRESAVEALRKLLK
jgi:histidyl-tRNA synthetase